MMRAKKYDDTRHIMAGISSIDRENTRSPPVLRYRLQLNTRVGDMTTS